jgi:hypothetical protein
MAIKVTKGMLKRSGYRWQASEGDNARLVKHDAIMFNRREGYEVVRMIQRMCDHFDYTSEEDVQRVETAIKTALPGNVRSQKNVQAWLKEYLASN